jgi:hypothetical protein
MGALIRGMYAHGQEEVKAAFAHLRGLGLINHGTARRAFNLSDRFKAGLAPVELPAGIFEEAAAAEDAIVTMPQVSQPHDPRLGAVPVTHQRSGDGATALSAVCVSSCRFGSARHRSFDVVRVRSMSQQA